MSDYELYHAGVRKHRYIKKIGNRYFYTQQEIAAYMNKKKPDVTFEKGTSSDYSNPGGGKMKDYHLDFNKEKGSYKYRDSNGKEHTKEYVMSDKIGVKVGDKKIQVYNTTNKKYWKDDERWSAKRHGRLKSTYAEDGSTHTLDLADKKTYKKRAAASDARDKKLSDFQESQGWRKSDAEFKKEKKEKRKKRVKKAISKPVNSLKKQSAKGKRAAKKFYKNNVKPGVTVTYDEAKLK